MDTRHFFLQALAATGLICVASIGFASPLITAEEAARPAASAPVVHRAITRGPGIKLVAPDTGITEAKSPMDIKIGFEPRGGAKIDLGSLKVVYLKSPTVDLLERVKRGLSETGIDLRNAELPPGDHQLRITVQDSEGREGNAIVSLKVAR